LIGFNTEEISVVWAKANLDSVAGLPIVEAGFFYAKNSAKIAKNLESLSLSLISSLIQELALWYDLTPIRSRRLQMLRQRLPRRP
jgi:hypothetical protein